MTKRWLWLVLLANLLVTTAMYAVRPIVTYRALAIGADSFQVGLIAASYGVISLIIAVPTGRWIDRLGESSFMIAGTLLVTVSTLVLISSTSLIVLSLSMMALGAGQIMAAVAIQTLIANGGAPHARDGRFATQTVVSSLGQLIGPAIAGILAGATMRQSGQTDTGSVSVHASDAVFWFAAAISLVAFAAALCLWRWPPSEHAHHGRDPATISRDSTLVVVGRVLRIRSMPHAMLASLAALSTIDILAAYLPAYGVYYGLSVETVGLLLAVRGGASIASRALMLPLRLALGRRRLLVASMLVPAVALALLPFAGAALVPLFAAMVLVGFGLGLSQPLTLSWVAKQAPTDIRGAAMGMRLSANRLGQFALPAAVGFVAGAIGLASIFWSIGGLLALSAALITPKTFGEDEAPAATPR